MTRPAGGLTAGATKPSPSARYVALVRAMLERDSTPSGDPRAEIRLYASLIDEGDNFWRFMGARTRFIDNRLLEAISDGVDQVVILGAGYDGRAMRFRTPGVAFYELDLPATQDDKRRRMRYLRLDAAASTLVAADFMTDSVAEVLQPTTYDPRARTLFICEGVLLYLPRTAIGRLLAETRACAAPGSRLVTTFAIADAGTSRSGAAGGRHTGDPAERRQSFYTPRSAEDLLRRCGWLPELTENPDRTIPAAVDVAMFVQAVADGGIDAWSPAAPDRPRGIR